MGSEAHFLVGGVLGAEQNIAGFVGSVVFHPVKFFIGKPRCNNSFSVGHFSVLITVKLSRVEGRRGTVAARDGFRVNGDLCIVIAGGQRVFFVREVNIVQYAALRVFDGDFQPIRIVRVEMPAFLDRELELGVVRYLIIVIFIQIALLDELQAAERLDGLIRFFAGRRRDRAVFYHGVGVELAVIRGGRVEQLRVIDHREPVVIGNSGKDIHSGSENVDGGFSVIGERRRQPRDIRSADSDYIVAIGISRQCLSAVVVRCVVGGGYIANNAVVAQNRYNVNGVQRDAMGNSLEYGPAMRHANINWRAHMGYIESSFKGSCHG